LRLLTSGIREHPFGRAEATAPIEMSESPADAHGRARNEGRIIIIIIITE
jgi:hypothetical protein